MTVLMIAPTRADLPNVAVEAAAVVNSLGGRLLQGPVTERELRDAAAEGGYDGIWFATHTRCDRVLLAEEELSEEALVAYVAASGASWCFLNSCQSIAAGQRLIDETRADVICTVSAQPDAGAMRTGVLFARQVAALGDVRAAYERSKPGGNRLYVFLENYRQREMAAIASTSATAGNFPAAERLQTTMDEMRRDMSRVASDVEVLKSQTTRMETRQQRMEDRLDKIEHELKPIPTWQTWAMLAIGGLMCVLVALLLLRLGA